MLNKLQAFIRRYDLVQPGDCVICAVSGGADSMALLWAMYLLKEKLQIKVSAAHFNHGLRQQESDRDEGFVREFCHRYEIPLFCTKGQVTAGKKGLEAAARDARYAFLNTLPGKIATAHTANDNAETVLMHMVRGTGLKGLGGIAPICGKLIRPMLGVTRQDVLAILEEYHVRFVQDSSNDTDLFLRNRLRHHVIPLLEQENPCLAENLSAMALVLREDEAALSQCAVDSVAQLKAMDPARRSRALAAFLQKSGVKEPEREHIALAENLVFSCKPSAKACFPDGVTVSRNYDRLEANTDTRSWEPVVLKCPGEVLIPELHLRVRCIPAQGNPNQERCFAVVPKGNIVIRPRQAGDEMRLHGGSKQLKKLFIDRKIPAPRRMEIPVAADEAGVLGVCGFGPNLDRIPRTGSGVEICFEYISQEI